MHKVLNHCVTSFNVHTLVHVRTTESVNCDNMVLRSVFTMARCIQAASILAGRGLPYLYHRKPFRRKFIEWSPSLIFDVTAMFVR